MLNTTTYSLPYSENAWRRALLSVASMLPSHAHPDNLQALQLLPIFAVVVVIDNDVLKSHADTPYHSPDELMLAWTKEHTGWALAFVRDVVASTTVIRPHQESATLSDVSVFRYILIPTNKTLINSDKKDAAAHIIDEQVTAYLRKKLKPKPNYNYTMNNVGEVVDFNLTTVAMPKRHYVDCHILSISQVMRGHKLACFDMDSTLIKQEVIVELAKMAGIGEQVNEITESAMRGEIDFATSFTRRVALLKGTKAEVIEEIKSLLIPQPGAFAVIKALKALGYHTALISGGFVPFAEHIAHILGIDEYYANDLDIENGVMTGEVVTPIIDGNQKARIVAKIADRLSISLDEVVCIGDGANDLPMMSISDLGIAYRAKPIVQVKADAAINVTGLEGVLYALGHAALIAK